MFLQVARSFMDDPREGMFARDLVASFIREGAAGQGYEDAIAALQQALRVPPLPRRGEAVYTNSNPIPFMPRLPGDFGPALAVCDGTEASFYSHLASSFWRMSNDVIDGVGTLTLSFTKPFLTESVQSRAGAGPGGVTTRRLRCRLRRRLPMATSGEGGEQPISKPAEGSP